MKILILTQKLDKNDDVLGFFHRWLKEFSLNVDEITVICLEKGECDLPINTKVFSLGKEGGASVRKYLWRFYKYIFKERNNYERVFVHMNEEYVLLGSLLWSFWGKEIAMWRNHAKGNFLTKCAAFLSDRVFCTSDSSYTARFSKTQIMPVGVDTDYFERLPEVRKVENSLLFLGRIAPVKKIECLLDAMVILKTRKILPTLNIYGKALAVNLEYEKEMKSIAENKLPGQVVFRGSVKNDDTVIIYNQNSIFVNMTPSGSFDKTIIEAMSCQTLTLSANTALLGKVPEQFIFEENNAVDLADKLEKILKSPIEYRESSGQELRKYVVANHSLSMLSNKLFSGNSWKT